ERYTVGGRSCLLCARRASPTPRFASSEHGSSFASRVLSPAEHALRIATRLHDSRNENHRERTVAGDRRYPAHLRRRRAVLAACTAPGASHGRTEQAFHAPRSLRDGTN